MRQFLSMKPIIKTLAFSFLAVLASCGEQKPEILENTITSVKEEQAKTDSIGIDPMWGIQELAGIKDGGIVLKGNGGTNLYYVLSEKTHALQKAFGKSGSAGNEWIAPVLALSDEPGKMYVIDNGKHKLYTLSHFSVTKDTESPVKGLANSPQVNAGYLYHTDLTPNKISLIVRSLSTGEVADSISFIDPKNKGMAMMDDFVYGVGNGTLVIAHAIKDRFEIYSMSSAGKSSLLYTVQGQGKTDDKEYAYYSSVAFSGEYIYLLSQRHVSLSKMSGYSSIEVYTAEGKAVRNIKLDMIAGQMAVSADGKTAWLLSATDGSLRRLQL